MCGISGHAGPPKSIEPVRQRYLEALEAMAHRGPDAEGEWAAPGGEAWLGHRRLAIVDLSEAGRQPMQNEDGTLHLVCNGEIYNHPTLRRELESSGHRYSSHSDSETILHAYETWGTECVSRLEGMFAFALWDETRQRLVVARDSVGIKPLYYATVNGSLVFASEAEIVRRMLGGAEINPLALGYLLTLGYIPSPHSIWSNIQKLEAGHGLTWNAAEGIRIQRFWEPPREIDDAMRPDPKAWNALWHQVIKDHLLSDVPLGLFLSGGLDSSAVALGLSQLKQDVEGITIGFPSTHRDESAIAQELCRHLGMRQTITPLETGDIEQLATSVGEAYDEPQGYSALMSMYRVSEIAARSYKVILAGDGGDEVFGGYKWYPKPAKRKPWWKRGSGSRHAKEPSGPSAEDPWKQFSRRSRLHAHAARVFPRFFPEEVERLLAPLGLRFAEEEMLEPLRRHFVDSLPVRRALQRVDLMTFCTDSILAKVDRASMAHSLEVRVPFLDRRIVDWGLSLPLDPRREREAKWILRRYLKGRVPDSVLDHPKQGFSVGVLDTFDWGRATERIRESAWVRDRFWSDDWESLLDPSRPYHQARMWTLYQLSAWSDMHLQRQS